MTGGDGNDTLTGGEGNNTLTGGAGDDTLTGGAGNDTMTGGAGNDTLTAGAGNNTITGGEGNDTFNVNLDANPADLSDSDVLVVSATATANATVTAAFTATSETKNDGTAYLTTTGFAVDLSAAGGANGFTVTNSGGATTITGSAHDDTLTAGGSGDTITGGAGADTLTGGAGADSFVYKAITDSAASVAGNATVTFDTISNFTWGSDKINLAAINTALTGGTAATTITVGSLTTGAGSMNDTSIANFADLKTAIEDGNLLSASSDTGLQAYVIDLTDNTGGLGTGKYLLVNDSDTTMDIGDLLIQLTGTNPTPVAGDFTLA
jgi:Ca2+-binding RTX toxin-like protein